MLSIAIVSALGTMGGPLVKHIEISDLSRFTKEPNLLNNEVVLTSGPIDPGIDWNEVVPSWNIKDAQKIALKVELRTVGDPAPSEFFSFGTWSPVGQAYGSIAGLRTSVKGQKSAFGEVFTDTLILNALARQVEVRLTFTYPVIERESRIEQLTSGFRSFHLSFRNSTIVPAEPEPNKSIWGTVLEVPRKSQMSYENGGVLCSPTATSMVLNYWAEKVQRPDWKIDVPEVVLGVFDPAYQGTGNWSFNTSFAGSLPGIKAFVANLQDISELERAIQNGFPVVCSVSYAMLKGKESPEPNDGHLVVLVGFDSNGRPVFNDPGRSLEVRQTYERAAFLKAWSRSGRATYWIFPEEKQLLPVRNTSR